MSTMNIFEKASRGKYRYPTPMGNITTEQLWDLPLTARGASGASLDATGQAIIAASREVGEESLVEENTNSALKDILATQLEIVKYVIAEKQNANKVALKRKENRERREKILLALDSRDSADLASKSKEDLLKELETLD